MTKQVKLVEITGDVSRRNRCLTSRDLTPQLLPLSAFKPLGRATRKHSPQQVGKLAESLNQFGFVLPILIDADGRVVAGWGLVLAARRLGLSDMPAVRVTDLSEPELRALRLALNRISEDATWDNEALALEFSEILDLRPVDLRITGFETAEIDLVLDGHGIDEEDELPAIQNGATPVSQTGDLWQLGEHRIYCGDALHTESFAKLLEDEKAQMGFTDPPYNVQIHGHVSGLGKIKHREFAMASGELSPAEFEQFLRTAMSHAANHSLGGAIHFVCCDWRHIRELIAAAGNIYSQQLNMCVWNKSNAGMGSLYRSKHELVFVFKVGKAAHINNVALGRYGRSRTNVWDYVSQSALNGTARSKLSLHPTVKPVAMIADAIRDCSKRGGLILDPFGGAGTTLIAAERTNRRARVIELNPIFVDVSIERWQRLTGGTALHATHGQPFMRPSGVPTAVIEG